MTCKVTLTIECNSLLDAATIEEYVSNNIPKAGVAINGIETKPARKPRKKYSGKLGPARVREIYEARHRMTVTEAAAHFGISSATASRILSGKHPLVERMPVKVVR